MPNKRVYGKRTSTRAKATAQCFLVDDSAVREVIREGGHGLAGLEKKDSSVDTEQLKLEKEKGTKENESLPIQQKDDQNMDAVIKKLAEVQIHEQKQTTDHAEQTKEEVDVLGPRDANRVTTQRKRRDSYDRKPLKPQAKTLPPSSTPPVEALSVATSQTLPDDQSVEPTPTARTLRVQHRPKPSISSISTLLPDLIAYTQPLLSLSGTAAAQAGPVPFQLWADRISRYFSVSKIAEASYGEVYRLSLHRPRPGFSHADESVLKIVALKPPALSKAGTDGTADGRVPTAAKETKKSLAMSSIPSVASEVRLLQLMSPVPGFTRFRDALVTVGRLPSQFIAAWRTFHAAHPDKSLFPDPGRKSSYNEDQLWAVIEMQDAGTDLETLMERGDGEVDGVEQVWDIFWGVACAVAKGEGWADFEHRDLHLGNICVRHTSKVDINTQSASQPHTCRKVGFTSLETTIIDYTLSRASLCNSASAIAGSLTPSPISNVNYLKDQSDSVAFFDATQDPSIFAGDASENYQYAIYRHMRGAVMCGDPTLDSVPLLAAKKTVQRPRSGPKDGTGGSGKERSRRRGQKVEESNEKEDETEKWRQYHPITNLVWLHFVLHELLRQPRVSTTLAAISSRCPSSSPSPSVSGSPSSSTSTLLPEQAADDSSTTNDLALKLLKLGEILSLENLQHPRLQGMAGRRRGKKAEAEEEDHNKRDAHPRMGSAAELLLWAVAEGWLAEEDVGLGCSEGGT